MSSDENAEITKRDNSHIDSALFRKIIDDIAEFNEPIKMLELGMHGEPFTNPQLAENVAYAKRKPYFQRIGVVTNGSLLSPKRAMPVIEAGIDQIDISLNGTSGEHFLHVTQTRVDFEKFVSNVKYLYENKGNCMITIKMMEESLTDDQKKIYFETFSSITDQIFLEHMVPYWNDALSYDWPDVDRTMLDEEIHHNAEVCPFPFYKMRITSDGKALLCSADWDHLRPIGDLHKQSVKEIWNSDVLRQIQLKFLRNERGGMDGCRDCEMFRYTQLVHLDPYREQILKKYLDKRECK